MDTLIACMCWLFVGFFIGKIHSYVYQYKEIEEDEKDEEPLLFTIETHDSSYIAYDENECFVAQEKILRDLVNRLISDYSVIALTTADEKINDELLKMNS